MLAIRYSEPFRREVHIIECKSGQEGPMDRVFWLAGVKQYVEANHASLVRHTTKWNIKDFAGAVGIAILDLPHVEELERSKAIDSNVWLGSSDKDFFSAYESEWNRAILIDPLIKELFFTLAGEVRFHEPFGGINFLLHHLRALTRNFRERRFSSESLTRFLISESICQLAMFLMRVAELGLPLSATDRDGMILKGLTYGQMDKPFIDRIFRNAQRITSEMIRHYTGKDLKVDDSYFTMPAPPNVKEIQAIVKSLVLHPSHASSFPAITDLIVSEIFLKQRNNTDWLPKIFPYLDLDSHMALVEEYISALQSIEAAPQDLLRKKADTASLAASKGKPTTDSSVASKTPEEAISISGEQAAQNKSESEQQAIKPAKLFD